MKLTSSPSVFSSTSFRGIFPTSKGSVFGCLSFMLRGILCSRSLPTRPSDQLKGINPFENHNPHFMKSQRVHDSATPNLVARLMGLDSMSDINTQKGSPSITRSKSMNSVDCRFGEVEEMQGQHRRVKTSVSISQTPSYFELEDDDFFVLSFENVGRNRKSRSKKVKSEMGRREFEQRRRRKGERVQNKESGRGTSKEQGRPSFKISEGNSHVFVLQIENPEEIKSSYMKKKKEKCLEDAKVETESESENSSPVSVLDHSLFISDHEVPTSEAERSNRSSSPRRKLASELSNIEHPSSDHKIETCPKGNEQDDPDQAIKGTQAGLQRKDYHRHQNIELLHQICRLAEAEMEDLEWKCKSRLARNSNNWEFEIGVELGLQIGDQLVDEVVYQLL